MTKPDDVPAAIERFAAKCEFDPGTGCVLWTGGTTSGQGNTVRYGSFWFDGRRWFAHRFAAQFIHGIEITGTTVGHCCKPVPNSLCVEHLEAQSLTENVGERNTRYAANQRADERQGYLLLQLGINEPEPKPEPPAGELDGVPFYDPPAWFREHVEQTRNDDPDDCPF